MNAILAMSGTVQDIFAQPDALPSLRQVNIFFLSMIRHSLYGAHPAADRIVNRLLLLSICACEALQRPQLQAAQPPVPSDGVGWLSSARAVELDEHLELHRNVLAYISGHHPASASRPHNKPDPDLERARQIMQRLRPRINNLSRWTTGGGNARRAAGRGAGRMRETEAQQRRSSGSSRPAAARNPVARPIKREAAAAPTTPSLTQSNTLRVVALPDTQPPSSRRPGPAGAGVGTGIDSPEDVTATLPISAGGPNTPEVGLGWVEEATQLVEVGNWRLGLLPTPRVETREVCAPRDRSGGVQRTAGGGGSGVVFSLRPEHVPSMRCCWWSGVGGACGST